MDESTTVLSAPPAQDRLGVLFQLQRENRRGMGRTTARQRKKRLKKLEDAILAAEDRITEALFEDLHKPAAEVLMTEIYPVKSEIRHARRHLHEWMRPQPVSPPLAFLGARCELRWQPRGVVLIISPWNFPFQLGLGPLVSAIAAGNCAILKPSESSPHTSALLQELISGVFPESEAAVVEGGKEAAVQLLEYPFDHVFFTGSTSVGAQVMAAAAGNLTSVTLELGGKSPVFVHSSANIERAAQRIAWGKFINAGQTCVAPDYLLVAEEIAEEFEQSLIEAVTGQFGSPDKTLDSPDYCRLINQRHFERTAQLLQESVSAGARISFGGIVEAGERAITPTVLSGVQADNPIMSREIFGPLLPILTYQSLAEGLAIVNSLPHPLALYIFAQDTKACERIIRETRAGDTLINDVVVHFSNTALPFGGVGLSGMGKSHGVYGFQAFSHLRSVMWQPRLAAISLLKPPYTDRVKKLIRLKLEYFAG